MNNKNKEAFQKLRQWCEEFNVVIEGRDDIHILFCNNKNTTMYSVDAFTAYEHDVYTSSGNIFNFENII